MENIKAVLLFVGISCAGLSCAGYPPSRTLTHDDEPVKNPRLNKGGTERMDRASFLNAVTCRYEPRGVVLTIRIRKGVGINKSQEGNSAAKVMKEAISALQHQVDGGHLGQLELEAARARLEYTRQLLDLQIRTRPAWFTHVNTYVVNGRGQPAHLQYSDIGPVWTDTFAIPDAREAGMLEMIVVLPAKDLKPGDYTVILTPVDQANASSAAFIGSSDTISFARRR